MSNSNSFDHANKKILSMILHRDLEYAEAEHRIYSEFNAMLLEYQKDFIKGLKQKLEHFDLSFDEFVHRFNRLYGRYHVRYELDWDIDEDGREHPNDKFIEETFKGFNYAVRKHAKKLLKSDYPDLVDKLFGLLDKNGYKTYIYDDDESDKYYAELAHGYIWIHKESQRGSS